MTERPVDLGTPQQPVSVRAPPLRQPRRLGVRQLLSHLAEPATARAATEESRVRQQPARSARSAPELDEVLLSGGAT